jgi:hypothetical protein
LIERNIMSVTGAKRLMTTPHYGIELDSTVCDPYNNCNLTLTLRVHFAPINPDFGKGTGTAFDADNKPVSIVAWDDAWAPWLNGVRTKCEAFWSGKFWLRTPDGCAAFDFTDKGSTYRPNIYCRFKLKAEPQPVAGVPEITIVRLANGANYRSESAAWRDTAIDPQDKGCKRPGGQQIAAFHEIGHLLGLHHVNTTGPLRWGWLLCNLETVFSDEKENSDACYGVNDDETCDIMGGGSQLHEWHAKPWKEAIEMFTKTGQSQWLPQMTRQYPRTDEDRQLRRWPTSKPNRG